MSNTDLYGWDIPTIGTPDDNRMLRQFYQSNEVTMRAKAILRVNPFMQQDMNALMTLASMPGDSVTIVNHAAAMYGLQASGTIRDQLDRMNPAAQRATFNQLMPAQQMTLAQQGYRPPATESDNFLERIIKDVGEVGGKALGVVGSVGQALYLDDALNMAVWLGDRPFHLYRTIRMMPEWSQMLALAGAAAGVALLFTPLAPLGGMSLAALGAVGGGTLATAGSLGTAAILGGTLAASLTNPDDYGEAFATGWGKNIQLGERQFERGATRRADEILGDPRVINLAKDLALNLPNNLTVSQLAREIAGVRGTGTEVALEAMRNTAKRVADEGTPEYQKVIEGLTILYQQPQFQEAVEVLQRGKISIGRDVADSLSWMGLFGQESTMHTLISGSIDAAATLALDPMLLGSKFVRAASNSRFAIFAEHGGLDMTEQFRRIAQQPAVRRLHTEVADAVNLKDGMRLRRVAPEFRGLQDQLFSHRDMLAATNQLDDGKFTVDHFHDWITVNQQMRPIFQGYGTMRGLSGPIVLARTGQTKAVMRGLGQRLASFTHGLTDARTESAMLDYFKRIIETSGDDVANGRAARMFPFITHGDVAEELATSHFNVLHRRIATAAEEFEKLPVAEQALHKQQVVGATPIMFKVGDTAVDVRPVLSYRPDLRSTFDEMNHIWNTDVLSGPEALLAEAITPEILRKLALASDDFASWRQWGRYVSRVPGAGKFGRLAERVSTMAPAGQFIQLAGAGSDESIYKFVELSAFADFPQWARRDWANMIMWQPDTNMRMTMIQGFYENMLRLGGVDVLPNNVGEDLIMRFVNHVKQAYGSGGIDVVDLKTHFVRRTLIPSEVADGVYMPDMDILRKSTRGAVTAKLLGIAESSVVEAMQNKVWKPGVLLRIGFIPRAAGEEMLSFFMRGGIGQLGQELGARSLARASRYKELANRVADSHGSALILSNADQRILEQGALPAMLRPLSRTMARYEWTTPVNRVLQNFAEYYNTVLENGLLPKLEAGLERKLSRIAGTPQYLYDTAERAGIESARLAGMQLAREAKIKPTQLNRLAIATAIDSVVLGGPGSWRRMAVGGVHDDILDAAKAFQEEFGGVILREVGSAKAGQIHFNEDDSNRVVIRMVNEDGELRPVKYQVIRGERTLRKKGGDPLYFDALHDSVVRYADDPFYRDHVLPHVSRIKPASIDDYELGELVVRYGSISNWHVQTLVSEYLREPDYQRILARAQDMIRSDNSAIRELGTQLVSSLDPNNLTLESLRQVMLNVENVKVKGRFVFVPEMRKARRQIESLEFQLSKFAGNAAERSWVSQYLLNLDNDTVAWWHNARYGEFPDPRMLLFTEDVATRVVPYYNSWEDMVAQVSPAIKGAVRDPEYARHLGGIQGLSDTAGPVDRFGEATQRRGVAQIWLPTTTNYIPVRTLGQGGVSSAADFMPLNSLSFEQFIERFPDQGFVAERYDDIFQYFVQAVEGGKPVAVADRYLAQQITDALAGTHRPISAIDIGVDRLAVGADNTMDALKVSGAQTPTMWVSRDPNGFSGRLRSVGTSLDEAIDSYVDDMLTSLRQAITGRQTKQFFPRARPLDDGSQIAAVYERALDGELTPIPLDQPVADGSQLLFNGRGEPITIGDNLYFRDEVTTIGDTIMHELVNPVLEDVADARKGRSLIAMKKDLLSNIGNKEVSEFEAVRLYRSSPRDAVKVAADAPPWVEGLNYQVVNENVWDRFVRYGFDRVIGPSIDALARRPMAFHFFAKRYMQGMRARNWMRSSELVDALDNAFNSAYQAHTARLLNLGSSPEQLERAGVLGAQEARQFGEYAKRLAQVEVAGKIDTASWSTTHALSWLRGHTQEEMAGMLDRVIGRARIQLQQGTINQSTFNELEIIATQVRRRPYDELVAMLPPNMTTNDVLAYARQQIPELASVDSMSAEQFVAAIRREQDLRRLSSGPRPYGLFDQFSVADWETLYNAQRNYNHITAEVGRSAAIAAINDMVPFIDSHEFKTQFAEVGKPFMPFWYAEENFLKRWARTLWQEGVAPIRKMQLTYMGLQSAGTIRTDNTGQDWFIWPGSGMLQDVVARITGNDLPVGTMFQTATDSILPGFSSRVGTPQFGPLVSLPVTFSTKMMPELEPLQRGLLGDIAASRGILDQVVPTTFTRIWDAAVANEGDKKIMSAMMTAMSYLEANGYGLADDATAGQRDEYLRRVRNWARVIVVAQAIGGFFSPGPLTPRAVSEDAGWVTGDEVDPVSVLNSTYIKLVQDMGIEKGTETYLSMIPNTDLSELVGGTTDTAEIAERAMAATATRSESRSGAPLPATEMASQFYSTYAGYLNELPYAGPWLLPVDEAAKSERSIYAYDQQTINELRRMETPEEFLDELKFKEGASRYFAMRSSYLDAVEAARGARRTDEVQRLNNQWEYESKMFLAAHPIFAERLNSQDSRDRRQAVISEMRIVVRDPDAPQTPVLPLLRQMIMDFDDYMTYKAQLSLDTSARGRLQVERFKGYFETKMNQFVLDNPSVRSFWLSVLRPESALE